MALLFCIFSLLTCIGHTQSPPDIIDKIVQTMIAKNASKCRFFQYNYGTAIIFDSMYRATKQFSPSNNNFNTTKTLDYDTFISNILNDYLYNDTNTPAYMITNGEVIPWNTTAEGAIGDHVGLYPITYLDQLLYQYI
eukprot:801179_1